MIPGNTRIKVLEHYCNDSASTEWLAMCRAEEAEGERSTELTLDSSELGYDPYNHRGERA